MADSSRIPARPLRWRMRVRVVMAGSSSFTVDVGLDGFCTELMHVLPVGTPVEGLICFAGRDRFFSGRVAWARPGDIGRRVPGRLGVRFEEIDPDLARELAAREAGAVPDE